MSGDERIGVAQIGAGYWGRNLARNFHALGVLRAICDADTQRLSGHRESYADCLLTADLDALLGDPAVTALSIATPPATHAGLIRAAFAAGKDVYVEKPLCHELAEARELVDIAAAEGRVLMVGHLLRYHPCVEAVLAATADGRLGELRYCEARRLNVGRIPTERNVLWNFGPHDATLVLAVCGGMPRAVRCLGASFLGSADAVHVQLVYDGGQVASITLSWIHPVKEQRLLVVGSEAALVFDDTRPWAEKVQLFPGWNGVADGRLGTRDLPAPCFLEVAQDEPLRRECSHFLACCQQRSEALTGPTQALAVQALLDAAQRSLDADGEEVEL